MADASPIIPADLKPADGRFGCGPSKVRPEQLQSLVDVGASVFGTSHRQKPVKDVVARVRSGLRELFSLPDGYEVVLGNGGTTAFWDAAAFGLIRERSQHLTYGEFCVEVRHRRQEESVPRRPDRDGLASPVGAPRSWPTRPSTFRLGAQRDVDRRGCAGPAPGRVVERAHRDRRDLGCGRPAGEHRRQRRLLLRAAEVLRVRRRTVDRAHEPGRTRAGRRDPGVRPLDPRTSCRCRPQWRTAARTRRTTPRRWPPCCCSPNQIEWLNANGGLDWAVSRTADSSSRLYDWAEATEYATPFVTDPALRSQVVGTIDFDDAVDAAAVAKMLRANGIVDTEPYRKLGRNQLRIGMFPAIDPRTSRS